MRWWMYTYVNSSCCILQISYNHIICNHISIKLKKYFINCKFLILNAASPHRVEGFYCCYIVTLWHLQHIFMSVQRTTILGAFLPCLWRFYLTRERKDKGPNLVLLCFCSSFYFSSKVYTTRKDLLFQNFSQLCIYVYIFFQNITILSRLYSWWVSLSELEALVNSI